MSFLEVMRRALKMFGVCRDYIRDYEQNTPYKRGRGPRHEKRCTVGAKELKIKRNDVMGLFLVLLLLRDELVRLICGNKHDLNFGDKLVKCYCIRNLIIRVVVKSGRFSFMRNCRDGTHTEGNGVLAYKLTRIPNRSGQYGHWAAVEDKSYGRRDLKEVCSYFELGDLRSFQNLSDTIKRRFTLSKIFWVDRVLVALAVLKGRAPMRSANVIKKVMRLGEKFGGISYGPYLLSNMAYMGLSISGSGGYVGQTNQGASRFWQHCRSTDDKATLLYFPLVVRGTDNKGTRLAIETIMIRLFRPSLNIAMMEGQSQVSLHAYQFKLSSGKYREPKDCNSKASIGSDGGLGCPDEYMKDVIDCVENACDGGSKRWKVEGIAQVVAAVNVTCDRSRSQRVVMALNKLPVSLYGVLKNVVGRMETAKYSKFLTNVRELYGIRRGVVEALTDIPGKRSFTLKIPFESRVSARRLGRAMLKDLPGVKYGSFSVFRGSGRSILDLFRTTVGEFRSPNLARRCKELVEQENRSAATVLCPEVGDEQINIDNLRPFFTKEPLVEEVNDVLKGISVEGWALEVAGVRHLCSPLTEMVASRSDVDEQETLAEDLDFTRNRKCRFRPRTGMTTKEASKALRVKELSSGTNRAAHNLVRDIEEAFPNSLPENVISKRFKGLEKLFYCGEVDKSRADSLTMICPMVCSLLTQLELKTLQRLPCSLEDFSPEFFQICKQIETRSNLPCKKKHRAPVGEIILKQKTLDKFRTMFKTPYATRPYLELKDLKARTIYNYRNHIFAKPYNVTAVFLSGIIQEVFKEAGSLRSVIEFTSMTGGWNGRLGSEVAEQIKKGAIEVDFLDEPKSGYWAFVPGDLEKFYPNCSTEDGARNISRAIDALMERGPRWVYVPKTKLTGEDNKAKFGTNPPTGPTYYYAQLDLVKEILVHAMKWKYVGIGSMVCMQLGGSAIGLSLSAPLAEASLLVKETILNRKHKSTRPNDELLYFRYVDDNARRLVYDEISNNRTTLEEVYPPDFYGAVSNVIEEATTDFDFLGSRVRIAVLDGKQKAVVTPRVEKMRIVDGRSFGRQDNYAYTVFRTARNQCNELGWRLEGALVTRLVTGRLIAAGYDEDRAWKARRKFIRFLGRTSAG